MKWMKDFDKETKKHVSDAEIEAGYKGRKLIPSEYLNHN